MVVAQGGHPRVNGSARLTAYHRAAAECLKIGAKNNTPCWICGRTIRYRTTAAVHYLVAVADGGDPLAADNLVPAHHQCVPPRNSRRW